MLRKTLYWLVALAVLAGVLSILFYLYVAYSTRAFIFTSINAAPVTQAALVLGASVTAKGDLSPVLQQRADQAIALFKAGKVSKILVTGDNATLSHDEVDPVGKYMVANGVPKGDIFLDHAGFDTYSSMYRARDVFDVSSITIVSQPFHLPRAVYIARSLGLIAYASPAQHNGTDWYNWLREVPAATKAEYDILFSRIPKYLGEQYPIVGDGEDTWGGFSSTTIWQ
ncbi:MAG TPA: ElyC/SanA/YdcF family protein [Candidatus Paceibacterota bacterium]|nr:ElyC/SanA/YdcF family protein [Candidatus Paceibacterota bacterium]